ncbi:MAG: hypothetical protein HRT71_17695 [Flavobacteriales bacterium]|nr:hypothetical protein [Flavobacteriales bacterium]
MNTLLDWNKIGSIIDQHYKKGKSATGKADDLKLINGYVSYYTDDTIKSIYWNDKKEIIFSFFDTVQTFNYTARNPTPLEDKCIDARVTV